MQGWQTPYLGLRDLPRELTEFELQAFFSFSRAELELIARRRGDNHKLGLALHIGFVRMSGRPLNSVRAVPAVLLRHLGQMLDIATPDLASLRALYAREQQASTLTHPDVIAAGRPKTYPPSARGTSARRRRAGRRRW